MVESIHGFSRARHAVGPIVRVYADVTPPRPDPRVEVVARVLRKDGLFSPERDARTILAALDAMRDELTDTDDRRK